jgi:hypothetical protein
MKTRIRCLRTNKRSRNSAEKLCDVLRSVPMYSAEASLDNILDLNEISEESIRITQYTLPTTIPVPF